MKVKIGTPRRRQTSKSLRVCALDALAGVDDHDGGIHGGEHAVGVLGEILVARRVEQVDDAAVVFELQHGGGDRDAALAFQFHPVGGRGALVFARGHAAGELHRAAVEQEFLRQRRLAGVRVGNDGERAAATDLAGGARGIGRRRGGGGRGGRIGGRWIKNGLGHRKPCSIAAIRRRRKSRRPRCGVRRRCRRFPRRRQAPAASTPVSAAETGSLSRRPAARRGSGTISSELVRGAVLA